MNTDFFTGELERLGRDMVDVVAATPPDAPVPTCPGWDLRDLALHTGFVWLHKAETVRGRWEDVSPPWPQTEEAESAIDDLASWFAAAFDELMEVFSTADLDRPSYTWCGHDHTAEWWVRRMAHETLIHGIDARAAAGIEGRVASALGEDGVDEILDEMIAGAPEWATVDDGDRTVVLIGDGRRWGLRTMTWSGTSPNTGTTYTDEAGLVHDAAGRPDVAIVADALDLDIWLWGRGPVPDGSVSGDASLVDFVRSVAAEATQ